jgi:hypothetical protein
MWADRLAPIFGHDLADHPAVVMKQLAAMRAYDATPRLHELAGLPPARNYEGGMEEWKRLGHR